MNCSWLMATTTGIRRVVVVAVLLSVAMYVATRSVDSVFVYNNPCRVPSSVECWVARMQV
jgi:hypothetical protein